VLLEKKSLKGKVYPERRTDAAPYHKL